jgi:hypothetical protein
MKCDLARGVAQGVKELELRSVVLGDRREVLVQGRLHDLERKNDFLWPEY